MKKSKDCFHLSTDSFTWFSMKWETNLESNHRSKNKGEFSYTGVTGYRTIISKSS